MPTQYISDFARFCGYDGIRYFSTFDKEAYNLVLFDSSTRECLGCKNHLIGNLDYNLSDV
ncbi:RES family NAD+ phosphorylase [Holdemanella sp. MSK.7.32]|uniref:RES family NAD+ phosphorylase n=1 Tax=Holdemanella sp. MSK.7.32 TaxID=2965273 RepID=UPI00352093C1